MSWHDKIEKTWMPFIKGICFDLCVTKSLKLGDGTLFLLKFPLKKVFGVDIYQISWEWMDGDINGAVEPKVLGYWFPDNYIFAARQKDFEIAMGDAPDWLIDMDSMLKAEEQNAAGELTKMLLEKFPTLEAVEKASGHRPYNAQNDWKTAADYYTWNHCPDEHPVLRKEECQDFSPLYKGVSKLELLASGIAGKRKDLAKKLLKEKKDYLLGKLWDKYTYDESCRLMKEEPPEESAKYFFPICEAIKKNANQIHGKDVLVTANVESKEQKYKIESQNFEFLDAEGIFRGWIKGRRPKNNIKLEDILSIALEDSTIIYEKDKK